MLLWMMGTESEILHQFRMLFPARVPNISPLRSTVLTKEARLFYYYYFLLFSSPREPH